VIYGLLIIGLGGRLAMALLAILLGYPANISFYSILIMLLGGMFSGIIACLLINPVNRFIRADCYLRGAVLGLACFTALAGLQLVLIRPSIRFEMSSLLTYSTMAIIFMAYGIILYNHILQVKLAE
jgi:hypothetical protein